MYHNMHRYVLYSYKVLYIDFNSNNLSFEISLLMSVQREYRTRLV